MSYVEIIVTSVLFFLFTLWLAVSVIRLLKRYRVTAVSKDILNCLRINLAVALAAFAVAIFTVLAQVFRSDGSDTVHLVFSACLVILAQSHVESVSVLLPGAQSEEVGLP
jgi:uncharacterized membrane protein